ncbi:trypsin-like serine protease [Photobacterium sp. Ph6]|uniref:trypsin-like serine protease n=1 Tax=Photobacterium sp. Ph6 TaxID=2790954 RepID=UPI001EDDC01F|nr:trypsin-like serine protease [Photobacterium sp. Ph6]MCG3866333.1 trypsin-like serine protease [Photobacterium sp. Ph6]
MKKTLITSLITAIPLIISLPVHANYKINGGSDTLENEFPYFGAVFNNAAWDPTESAKEISCGGVIIAGHYFVSAKHCFTDLGDDFTWWEAKEPGHQRPTLDYNTVTNKLVETDIVIGMEKQKYNVPTVFKDVVRISGINSDWEASDWTDFHDLIILDLSKYLKKDIQLTKAIYLGEPQQEVKSIPAKIIGFGATLCINGNCGKPTRSSEHLLQTNVLMDAGCNGLTYNEFLVPNGYSFRFDQKDQYVCSDSEKYNYKDKDEGYSNTNHGDSGGPLIVNEGGIDVTYGVAHTGIFTDKETNKRVIYQTFSKDAIELITQQVNGWNAPTVVEVNDIGKDYNITVQNLTVNDVNLFDSEDLSSSNNITLNSDSDCNRLTKPFEICQLSFSVNNDKKGFIELRNAGSSLKINLINNVKSDDLIPYDDKKNDDLIPYDDDNNDNNNGGGGGSLNFIAIFILLGIGLLRKRYIV